MVRALFLAGAGIIITHVLISHRASKESAMLTPLERGFVTTGKVCTVFSLQLLVFLVLLLISDLETIFIIRSVLVPGLGEVQKIRFLLLVIRRL